MLMLEIQIQVCRLASTEPSPQPLFSLFLSSHNNNNDDDDEDWDNNTLFEQHPSLGDLSVPVLLHVTDRSFMFSLELSVA